MAVHAQKLRHLVDQARTLEPIRVAVVDAAQGVVIETLREAHALGFVEPRLVGAPDSIAAICDDLGWKTADDWIVPASTDAEAAAKAVELARVGEADAVMKGDIHTDMGPLKAALEASVRYLAHELGPKDIRVNAISAGAVKTRAASGIEHFDELLNETMRKAPLRRTIDACEVGRAALLLASDYTTAITGEVLVVDAGFHIEGMVFH